MKLTWHALWVPIIISLFGLLGLSVFYWSQDPDADTNTLKSQVKYVREPIAKTIIVDQSGHGHFKSVQQAIDSIPQNNNQWICVKVRAGVYNEKVMIPHEKPFIMLVGESSPKTTVIQFNGFGDSINCTTFKLFAPNFVAKDIIFKNTYNLVHSRSNILRAPAALIHADKAKFYHCRFLGVQDTLTDMNGRHYFENCYIEGAVDFIWGGGQSIYQGCTINATTAVLGGMEGFITAQYRYRPKESSGFVFKYCKVMATGPAFLGRALKEYSRVIFYKSYMSNYIDPKGWSSGFFGGREGTITYTEVDSTGPGSNMSKRVKWLKNLPPTELHMLIDVTTFLNQEGWMERQPMPPGLREREPNSYHLVMLGKIIGLVKDKVGHMA